MKDLISGMGALAFIAVLAEVLLPEGSFQPYARMICGMCMLLLMATNLLHHPPMPEFAWEAEPSWMSTEAAEKERDAKLLVEFRRQTEENLKAQYGVDAHVEVDSQMAIQWIIIEGEPSDELRASIAKDYGLENEQVKGN